MTSNKLAEGLFDKRDFVYDSKNDEYRCPAGKIAIYGFTAEEAGKTQHKYWSSDCPQCPMKPRCTKGKYRRIARREHEDILDVVQQRHRAADVGHEGVGRRPFTQKLNARRDRGRR